MAKWKFERPSAEALNAVNTQQKEQRGGLYDSITQSKFPTYRTKKGENRLRLLPPFHGEKKYFPLNIFLHYNCGPDNGTYLCMDRMFGEDCAVCDEQRALREADDTEAANKLKASPAYIAWVIDRDDKNDDIGPQIFRYGYKMAASIATVAVDEESGNTLCVFDPEQGYDLYFTREDKGGGGRNVDYIGHRFARRDSPVHRDSKTQDRWLDFIYDHPLDTVLQKYDYDHIAKCFKGKRTVREDDEPSHREERLQERTSRSVRDDIDDDIPDSAGGNRPGERSPGRSRDDDDDRSEANVSGRARDDDDDRRSTRHRDDEDGDRRREPRDEERGDRRERDDPPFDGGTSRRSRARDDEEEEREARPERSERRERPRLADKDEGEDPHARASGAVSRLRERARRD